MATAAERAESASRLQSIEEKYAEGQVVQPYAPEVASKEYKALARRCGLNLVGVHVNGLVQDVAPAKYISPATGQPDRDAWVARSNLGIPEKARQARRWATVNGQSFIAFVPTPQGFVPRVYERAGVLAKWDDPINDLAPRTFIAPLSWENHVPRTMVSWDVDEGLWIWTPSTTGNGQRTTWGPWVGSAFSLARFGGEMPIIHYVAGEWSKYGGAWRPRGEVSPLISPQQRVIQAIFDMLLVQQFGAVAIRTMAGVDLPGDDDDAERQAIRMAANRVLVAEDAETKFGVLAGTPLNPFIDVVDAAIRHFSIVASLSPTRTAGKIENVSADAISSARQAEEDLREAYRERWTPNELRLTRMAMMATGLGDPGPGGEIIWRETEVRSLAQVADAASKFFAAEIPVRPLLTRSLNWSMYEVEQMQTEMAAIQSGRADSAEAIIADRRIQAQRALAAIGAS